MLTAKLSPTLDEKISHQLAHPLISEKMVNVVAPFEEKTKDGQSNVGYVSYFMCKVLGTEYFT